MHVKASVQHAHGMHQSCVLSCVWYSAYTVLITVLGLFDMPKRLRCISDDWGHWSLGRTCLAGPWVFPLHLPASLAGFIKPETGSDSELTMRASHCWANLGWLVYQVYEFMLFAMLPYIVRLWIHMDRYCSECSICFAIVGLKLASDDFSGYLPSSKIHIDLPWWAFHM